MLAAVPEEHNNMDCEETGGVCRNGSRRRCRPREFVISNQKLYQSSAGSTRPTPRLEDYIPVHFARKAEGFHSILVTRSGCNHANPLSLSTLLCLGTYLLSFTRVPRGRVDYGGPCGPNSSMDKCQPHASPSAHPLRISIRRLSFLMAVF